MAIHSDWGDWLPQEISNSNPLGVSIWYLGCNGFALKGRDGTLLFIDPYLGCGDPPRTVRMIPVPFEPEDVKNADAIFTTHEHVDHIHGPTQAPILDSSGARLYGPDDAIDVARNDEDWPSNYGVEDDQLVEVNEGETLEVGEFAIHVCPANDPDASHPVSYVFEHASGTFFHAGDSKPTPEFEDIGNSYDIDLGVLAFGSLGIMPDKKTGESSRTKWYNDENQIIEAATALKVNRLLPSHWDMWKRLTADPTVLHHHMQGHSYPYSLEVVEIGDSIQL